MMIVVIFSSGYGHFLRFGPLICLHKLYLMAIDLHQNPVTLKDATRFLLNDYHSLLELCDKAMAEADQPHTRPEHADLIGHARAFATEVRSYLKERVTTQIPYLNELAEKSSTGHDCAQCSGKCDLQHTMRLYELNKSIEKILNATEYIYTEFEHVYKSFGDNTEIRSLHSAIMLLNHFLRTVLATEVAVLVPRIKEAQREINAHS